MTYLRGKSVIRVGQPNKRAIGIARWNRVVPAPLPI
jgi:hypothetical protein